LWRRHHRLFGDLKGIFVMSVFDQLLEDIESDHKEWEERGRELADKRKKVKELGDRALDAHEGRYDAAQAAFQKLEDTAKRLQGNEPPPAKAPKTTGANGSAALVDGGKITVSADEVGDAGEVLGAPDQGGTFQQG
jgi:hypothetical protein